jgi:FAD/FMN-containing dehydrogenase
MTVHTRRSSGLGNAGVDDTWRAAYGDAHFKRLRQAKRRYDPHNLFRLNHNIPPAEA